MSRSKTGKKVFVIFFISILIISVSAELFLRVYLGFCNNVLLKEDDQYEYIAMPMQNRYRFGNHISYNSASMRSDEVDSSSVTILGFGDSVINGGVLTDQDSLATTILTNTLSNKYRKKIQFLNISAGSWGPSNCYAYLKKHGNFNAKQIFLFVSSHDAYDNMKFEKLVGINDNFPNKQHQLALDELFSKYIFQAIQYIFNKANAKTNKLGINKKEEGSVFDPGFKSFFEYSKANGIPLVLYLHAELPELYAGEYNEQGKEIVQWAKNNNVPLIQDLKNRPEAVDYRDRYHLTSQGQRKLAQNVLKSGLILINRRAPF